MALTDDNVGGLNVSMPVAPAYGYPYGGNMGGFGNGFGGDWSWILILFLFGMFGGGWNNGFGGWGGGFGGAYEFPWLLASNANNQNATNARFDTLGIDTSLASIQTGVNGISTQLCNGFGSVQSGIANAQNAISQQLYTNQLADLERSFAAQTANTAGLTALQQQLATCCCENRAATADVKYTIATEACASRATSTANTQAILDKLCQLELDGYKRENDQLRSQLQFANMQASQVAQTAEIRTNNATVANQLVAELRSCPIPAQPVYGNTPIFTCGGGTTCGCGITA